MRTIHKVHLFISLNQEAESLACVLIGYCQPTIRCSLRGPRHSLLRIHRQPAFLLPSPIYDFITARSSSQNFNCVQHKDLQIRGIDKSSVATGKEGDSTSHLCHLTQPSRFYTWYFSGAQLMLDLQLMWNFPQAGSQWPRPPFAAALNFSFEDKICDVII